MLKFRLLMQQPFRGSCRRCKSLQTGKGTVDLCLTHINGAMQQRSYIPQPVHFVYVH